MVKKKKQREIVNRNEFSLDAAACPCPYQNVPRRLAVYYWPCGRPSKTDRDQRDPPPFQTALVHYESPKDRNDQYR